MTTAIDGNILKKFIDEAAALMHKNKDYLIELDAAMGDGDLGLTMTTGFDEAKKFAVDCNETDLGKFLMKIGMVFAKAVPSTMGTLVASAFLKAGKEVSGKTELSVDDMVAFSHAFVQGIMERGKASPGDRTIIDSIFPAAEAMKKGAADGKNIADCCKEAYDAAELGVEKTKEMLPSFGRAVYFGDKALGRPDQGAIVGCLIYKALYLAVSRL